MFLNRSVYGFLRRLFHKKRARLVIDNKVRFNGCYPHANQEVLITGEGHVSFDKGVILGYRTSPDFYSTYTYIEARYPESRISIGTDSFFNNGVSIISGSREEGGIEIGSRVMLGLGVQIFDSDFHGILAKDRNNPSAIKTRPVRIGDDCWLGNSAIVLKGVTLGACCVLVAGSVVTESFPADSVIGGNPARLIKTLRQG